jgi:hypothetical protein
VPGRDFAGMSRLATGWRFWTPQTCSIRRPRRDRRRSTCACEPRSPLAGSTQRSAAGPALHRREQPAAELDRPFAALGQASAQTDSHGLHRDPARRRRADTRIRTAPRERAQQHGALLARAGRRCRSQLATDGIDRRIARCSYRADAGVRDRTGGRPLSPWVRGDHALASDMVAIVVRWQLQQTFDRTARFAVACAWFGERVTGRPARGPSPLSTRRRLCQTTSQLDGRGDQFGVVCGDATVWELDHVFQADAHVEPGGSAG